MNVSRETPSKRGGKPWSQKEIDFLTTHRAQWDKVAWLAEQLGRTEDAVGAKIGRLRCIIQPHRKPSAPLALPARRRRADREIAA